MLVLELLHSRGMRRLLLRKRVRMSRLSLPKALLHLRNLARLFLARLLKFGDGSLGLGVHSDRCTITLRLHHRKARLECRNR